MAHPLDDRQEKGRLTVDDVARLSEQIAGLTAAGLPLALASAARRANALGSISDRRSESVATRLEEGD